MRAFRILADGSGHLVDIAEPSLPAGWVRVAVTAAGLCHSDINVLDGIVGHGWDRPFTLGHEIAGTVIEVHPDADPAWLGTSCVLYAPTGCGTCRACRRDEQNYCTNRTARSEAGLGLGGDGGMAEQIVVRSDRLVATRHLDPAIAAVLTDAGLTAYHAASQVRHRGGSAVIVVIGVGGLGHLALQILRHLTAARLVAVDRRSAARDLAMESRADVFCSPEELAATLSTFGADGGAEAVLDFVGSAETIELATAHLLPDADLVVIGTSTGSLTVGKRESALPRGLHVHFPSWGSRAELAEVIRLAERGVLRPRVSAIDLDSVEAGLDQLREGRVLGRLVARPKSARPASDAFNPSVIAP